MLRMACLCFVLSCFFLSSVYGETVRFRLDATNTDGDVVNSVNIGDTFFLNAYAEDLGPDPVDGVFAAYMDVLIEPPIVSVAAAVEAGMLYQNGTIKGEVSPGLLDNFGGFSTGLEPVGAGEMLIFRQEMQADAGGQIVFSSAFANESPSFDVLRFGSSVPVLAEDIEFGSLTLQIAEVPEPSGGSLFCLGGLALMVSRRRRAS